MKGPLSVTSVGHCAKSSSKDNRIQELQIYTIGLYTEFGTILQRRRNGFL
jgi:hypothetical protein